MKFARIIILTIIFFIVIGTKINSNAVTSAGVFYWESSSYWGYYSNDGVWRSWNSDIPAQSDYRYDMNSNKISWDGYFEQSRGWGGTIFLDSDNNWKRKVNVTYYKPDLQVPATPTVNINPGIYYQPQWISLYSETGTIIRYTLDGNEPNQYSMIYTNPIYISNTTVIKVKAYGNGFGSYTFSGTYVIVATSQNMFDSVYNARNLIDDGKYNEAIEMLKRILVSDGKNKDAMVLLIECYGKRGDLYSAKNELDKYIGLYEYPRIINMYAEICIRKGENLEARNVIEDILPKYPDEIYLYNTLVIAYKNMHFDDIKIFANGKAVDFSRYDYLYPTIVGGRTIVPIRALSESLSAKVEWNYRLRKANIFLDNKIIEITDNSTIAKVDGINFRLDVPARIIDDRLMVPLRFISENFGREVNWFGIGNDAGIISVTRRK